MRLIVGLVGLVAVLQCCPLAAVAEGDKMLDVAAKKAVEESVAAPLSEFWKDLYDLVVRKQGSKAARRLRYMFAGLGGKNEALQLARFLMERLKKDVFQGRVNQQTWDALTMELYEALRDWWSLTPENPRDAADLGAWQALVNLHKNVMGPALRGSSRVSNINDLLLDPELQTIRRWVNDWRGTPTPQPEKAAEGGTGGKADSN
ncbi:dense-granule antigen DG32, putative [Eimeria mitis]|uniref:Dense-granule antigen DG32, putative n=1 Tax=Eimeria mitis TaxID=44415 RepID=U6K400_9EIME|nr:dense-granule antigen DG32, putative [Eimeria mitis]CDJ32450.1 dense-granule antigen DG32, putative [Eimeria mitis]